MKSTRFQWLNPAGTLGWRWISAIIVASVVGFAAFIPGLAVGGILVGLLSWTGDWWREGAVVTGCALTGAAGVGAGSFCLAKQSRVVGSTILLVLGLAFYWCFWSSFEGLSDHPVKQRFPHLFGLALGGGASVVWFMIRKSANKRLQPTPR